MQHLSLFFFDSIYENFIFQIFFIGSPCFCFTFFFIGFSGVFLAFFSDRINIFLFRFSFDTTRRQSYRVDNIGGCPETLCGGGDSGVSGDSTTPTGETPTESDRRGRGFEPRHWKKTYCQEHSKPIIFRIT